MTIEEKEQIGKYVLQMARLLEDGCYQQEMLLKAVCIIDEAIEQETVSKESYDHEYFLRKEFELKIDKLQRQLEEQAVKEETILDEIRKEIEEVELNITYKEIYKVGGEWGLRKALEIIDKYKSEVDPQESEE